MSQQPSSRIEFAHVLRGWAAMAVLVSHYYGVFWLKREVASNLTHTPILPNIWQTPSFIKWLHAQEMFNWGAYGVAIFFLISGFVMPFALQRQQRLEFLVNRIFRILPVYAIGFTLTLAALWLASHYYNREFPYALTDIMIHYIPGIRDLVGGKSIDGIIWTLEVEIKFYVICAVFLSLFAKSSLKVFIIPIVLGGIALVVNQWHTELTTIHFSLARLSCVFCFNAQFIIYIFIGVALNYGYRQEISQHVTFFMVTGLFLLFLSLWYTNLSIAFFTRWPSYGAAIVTFIMGSKFSHFFESNRFFDFFANISYPLYVCHAVAGYVLLRIFLDQGASIGMALTLTTMLSLCCAWMIHRSVEMPFIKCGKYIVWR
ncbi:acyltransferase family protein [Candidatus Paracaedibacter symbiosus]|uniref:acyltransferase family protein n=1 Tax=Candidatus Paracaedibacter symbiosus TaxID=244582 RepID=UPI00068DDF24|nr:acyltransferase [Candidatus Paracaedibacter symbiosus]